MHHDLGCRIPRMIASQRPHGLPCRQSRRTSIPPHRSNRAVHLVQTIKNLPVRRKCPMPRPRPGIDHPGTHRLGHKGRSRRIHLIHIHPVSPQIVHEHMLAIRRQHRPMPMRRFLTRLVRSTPLVLDEPRPLLQRSIVSQRKRRHTAAPVIRRHQHLRPRHQTKMTRPLPTLLRYRHPVQLPQLPIPLHRIRRRPTRSLIHRIHPLPIPRHRQKRRTRTRHRQPARPQDPTRIIKNHHPHPLLSRRLLRVRPHINPLLSSHHHPSQQHRRYHQSRHHIPTSCPPHLPMARQTTHHLYPSTISGQHDH